jgi:hypothetical protein
LKIIKYGTIAVCPNPVVVIVASCIPETYCYYEHYNDQEKYMKCTSYVLKCIFEQMRGSKSCLVVVGGDVFIEWYKYGIYINNYDYKKIVWDVLKCKGVDEWTRNYIKKTIWGWDWWESHVPVKFI